MRMNNGVNKPSSQCFTLSEFDYDRSLVPEGRMHMLLKGTDRTLFGTRRLVAIWRHPWTIGSICF